MVAAANIGIVNIARNEPLLAKTGEEKTNLALRLAVVLVRF